MRHFRSAYLYIACVCVVSVVFEFWLPGSWRPALATAFGARSLWAFTIWSPKVPVLPFGTG